MILSTAFAEPPPSISYGVPSYELASSSSSGSSAGYSYESNSGNHITEELQYINHPVGHQPNEGIHIDERLLNTVKQVLLAHESSQGSAVTTHNRPSSSYGVPSSSYGVPSSHGWQSNKVSDIIFGDLKQSIPVAYYIGLQKFTSHNNNNNHGWQRPSISYGPPAW
jgi:hypothetical protein